MSSRSLGVLTLDLVARTGGFQQGMDQAARVADKRMKEMESRARKFGAGIGTALKAGAAVAATGWGLFVANTIEAEKAQAQLAARIKDTAGAAGRTLEQLNAQADRLQLVSIFDDESVNAAQAMLLTFKEVQGVQFDAAIEAALDLATVMGTDATDAAKTLGKALSDPEKGMTQLARSGIVFSEAEREVIKAMVETGDKAGAQAAIVKKLEGSMGTAAEAARNTLGGALQGLKNTFDNLLEGDTSSGGMKATVDTVNRLNDAFADPSFKQGIDSIASGFGNLAVDVAEGTAALANFFEQYGRLSDIRDLRASGAPASSYSDDERNSTIALLSKGKRKALASGDQATADRLQNEITALIRASTESLKADLVKQGVDAAFDFLQASVAAGSDRKVPPGGGGSRIHENAAKAVRDLTQAQREYAELIPEIDQKMLAHDAAIMEWQDRLEELQAHLDGPQQEAMLEHRRRVDEVTSAYAAGLLTLKDYDAYMTALGTQNQRAMDAIASPAQRQAMEDQIGLMDDFRMSVGGLFTDIYEGKNAWDSVKDAFDSFAASVFQFAQSKVLDQLFGPMGTNQTGSSGGWLGAVIGAFTSGYSYSSGGVTGSQFADVFSNGGAFGFAKGGYTGDGRWNEPAGIVHKGEYVIPAPVVQDIRNGRDGGTGGGVTVVQQFYNPRLYDRRSDSQRAMESAMKLRTATKFA